jgi:hypothetical protein
MAGLSGADGNKCREEGGPQVSAPERPFRNFSTRELLEMRREGERNLSRKEEERSSFTYAAGEPFQEFLTQLRAIQDHLEKIENELKHRRDARGSTT